MMAKKIEESDETIGELQCKNKQLENGAKEMKAEDLEPVAVRLDTDNVVDKNESIIKDSNMDSGVIPLTIL